MLLLVMSSMFCYILTSFADILTSCNCPFALEPFLLKEEQFVCGLCNNKSYLLRFYYLMYTNRPLVLFILSMLIVDLDWLSCYCDTQKSLDTHVFLVKTVLIHTSLLFTCNFMLIYHDIICWYIMIFWHIGISWHHNCFQLKVYLSVL